MKLSIIIVVGIIISHFPIEQRTGSSRLFGGTKNTKQSISFPEPAILGKETKALG